MDESSDDDIEIIATKEVRNKILEVHSYEETKKDLEEIEQKCFAEKSQQTLPEEKKREKEDINISIRKSAMNITISMASGSGINKRKKDNDIICIDSDDGSEGEREDDDVQVKVIVSGGGQNKRQKTGDSREKSVDNLPSSSKLSTSEIFLNKQQDEESSEEISEEEILVEESKPSPESPAPLLERKNVSHCMDSFLGLCRRILPQTEFPSVEKKLMKNLNKLDPKYQCDDSLKNYIEQKWSLVNSEPDSLYVHVKEVLEELKKFRSESSVSSGDTSEMSDQELIKTQTKKRIQLTTLSSSVLKEPEARDEEDEPSPAPDWEPETEPETSKQKNASSKHIRKLEAALAACAKQVKKCEEGEIDWEKDDESNFLMADRWKKKYMSIYFKLAEYNGLSKSLERSSDKKFSFNESKFPAINRKIEKFVNRTKSFPDFWDIKKQIENINTEDSLRLTEMQIHNEAEKIFISVGRRLKKRRNIDDGSVMFSYLNPAEKDPALNDAELDNKLVMLGKEAKEKIDKVFEEYTEKQAAGVRNNEEESETEEEEEEEEEGENNGDPDMESFVTDESALEVEEIAIGGEEGSDVDDAESLPRPISECSIKSSGSLKDLLEDSD